MQLELLAVRGQQQQQQVLAEADVNGGYRWNGGYLWGLVLAGNEKRRQAPHDVEDDFLCLRACHRLVHHVQHSCDAAK